MEKEKMMEVKIDLWAGNKKNWGRIKWVMAEVAQKSAFVGGAYVARFEEKFASYCGTKYAVGVNSGTDAIYLTLRALGVGKGDEVITTPYSFFATAGAVMMTGARPVFVDIDEETYNLDAEKIEEKIGKRTKVILPVHLFGLPAEMRRINDLARKYGLWVIEDACQAVGAEYGGKRAGNLGTAGCFSFYPTKNLGGFGDGGMVVTNNLRLAGKVRLIKNHGMVHKYENEILGVNSRLDALQAAVLEVKLGSLVRDNRERKKLAAAYSKLLGGVEWIGVPKTGRWESCWHQYTVRVKNGRRNELKDYLGKRKVWTEVYYPIPLHLMGVTKHLGYKRGDLPVVEKASAELLSLPIYPGMGEKKLNYVVEQIKQFGA